MKLAPTILASALLATSATSAIAQASTWSDRTVVDDASAAVMRLRMFADQYTNETSCPAYQAARPQIERQITAWERTVQELRAIAYGAQPPNTLNTGQRNLARSLPALTSNIREMIVQRRAGC